MRAIAQDTQNRILKEQFIPDHVLLYVAQGSISFFDGSKSYLVQAGEGCLVRKNRLVKFQLATSKEPFEPVLFCFEQAFLRHFQQKHQPALNRFKTPDAVLQLPPTAWLTTFVQSLQPYYQGIMQLDEAFEDLKYEELLLLLLKHQPELAGVLFEFSAPAKINLEAFMHQNYTFNVGVERFAYLTGRSLSAFKRDFRHIFHETPQRWLLQRRLQEAHFLISKQQQKPSAIYLALGFETLSHFSVAFKKHFGLTSTELAARMTGR